MARKQWEKGGAWSITGWVYGEEKKQSGKKGENKYKGKQKRTGTGEAGMCDGVYDGNSNGAL